MSAREELPRMLLQPKDLTALDPDEIVQNQTPIRGAEAEPYAARYLARYLPARSDAAEFFGSRLARLREE